MNAFKKLINKLKPTDAATDARQMLLCMLCTKSLCLYEPIGYLTCCHMVHMDCLWEYYNIQNEKKNASGSWTKADPVVGVHPTKVECPVCNKITTLPPGHALHCLENAPKGNLLSKVWASLALDFKEDEQENHKPSREKNSFYHTEYLPGDEGPYYEPVVNIFSSQTTDDNPVNTGDELGPRTIDNNLDNANSIGHNIKSPRMQSSLFQNEACLPPGHIDLMSDDNNRVSKISFPASQKSKDKMYNERVKDEPVKNNAKTVQKITKLCCREHKQRLCTHICDTCELPVCEKCTKDLHKDHPVSSMEDEILALSNKTLPKLQEELQYFRRKGALYEGQLEYLLQKQEENFESMKNEVIRHAIAAKEAIEVQRLKFIDELENAFKAQRAIYDQGVKQVRYNKQCTEKLHSILSEMRHGSEAQLVMNRMYIEPRVKTHIANSKGDGQWVSWLQTKAVFSPFQFKSQLGELYRQSIELPETILSSNTSQTSSSRSPLQGIQHEKPQVCWTKMDKPHFGHVENANPQGTLFLPDNSLLVAYEGKQCISKFIGKDLDLSFNVHDKRDHFMPRDMAKLNPHTVVATDSRYMTLRLFENDGSNLRCLKKELFRQERRGEQSDPFGVAMLPRKQVAVSDSAHRVVYIVDPETEKIISTWPSSKERKVMFQKPQFLSFDSHQNRLLVTDTQAHTVKLFDLNGTFISEMGNPKYVTKPKEFQDGTYIKQYEGLQEPAATACDMNGNILVVDGGHHQICQFDRSGQFVSIVTLYDKLDKVSLFWPRGIAIGPKGEVAITEKTCSKVTVFQLYK